MFQQTPNKRVLFRRTLTPVVLGLLSMATISLSMILGGFAFITPHAHAATSSTINFQARLEGAGGNIAADGMYNIQFKLYSASAGGSALWTESYYDANGVTAGQDNRTQVTNGFVTVSLGSQTAFPALDWNQNLYLSMNIGGTTQTATPTYDGEMSPRLALTAVPYAFKAGQLAQFNAATGFTSTLSLIQPTAGNQTFQVIDQAAAGTYTICVQGATAANGGCAASTGAAGYIQNQSASAQATSNFWISGTGKADTFNAATALQTGGVTRVDASGNLTNIGNIGGSGTLQLSGGTGSSYIMSALGLGTTSPQAGSALTIANGSWLSAVDSVGTGYVNMFQLNSSNEIQVGAALNVAGGIVMPTNGGQMTFSDLPIDGSATAGTPESYTMRVGSSNALTVYGEADGSGNAQNIRVAIGSSIAPAYTLDVGGDANITGSYRINGTAVCTSSGCTASSGSGSYIQNGSTPQTANFNITGNGTIGGTLSVTGAVTGGTYNLQTISSAANFTGTLAVATSISTPTITTASGDLTIDPVGNTVIKGSTSVTGTAALNIQNSTASILYARNDGNIGIGTTTPGASLEVYKAAGSATILLNSAAPSYGLIRSGGNDQSVVVAGGTVASEANGGFFQVTGNTYSTQKGQVIFVAGTPGTPTGLDGTIQFRTGGVAAASPSVIIDRSGNVGVGTTGPGYKLDVQGGDINTSANLRTGGTIRLDNAGNLSNINDVSALGIISGNNILSGNYASWEYGINGDNITPISKSSTVSSVKIGTTKAYDGSRSVELVTDGVNTDGYVYPMGSGTVGNVSIKPGGKYAYSVYAKSATGQTPLVQAYVRMSDGTFFVTNSANANDTTWTRYVSVFTAPATATSLAMRIDVDTASSTVYFDGFMLEEIPASQTTASAWSPNGSLEGVKTDYANNIQLDANLNLQTGVLQVGGTTVITAARVLQNVTGYSQGSGNFDQTGAGTFGTGTGAVSLNGDTTIASGKIFTAAGSVGSISTTTTGNNLNFSRSGANYITATDVTAGNLNLGVNANVGALIIDVTGASTFNGNVVLAAGKTLTVGTGATSLGGTLGVTGAVTGSSTIQGTQLISTVATGTAPLTVASTTQVTNLNSDLLDGLDSTAFAVATGGTGYIQNQTASPQAAGFNIDGNGTIGGALAVTGNTATGSLLVGGTVVTKTLYYNFANGIANQKVDIYLPAAAAYGGSFDVSITSSFSNQNANGEITKKFNFGGSGTGTVYTNNSYYTVADPTTAANFAISGITWDATNGRWRIQIVHRVSTGNAVSVVVKGMAYPGVHAANLNAMAVGTDYTTDATVFAAPEVEYNNNVSFKGTGTGLTVTNNASFGTIGSGAITSTGAIQGTSLTGTSLALGAGTITSGLINGQTISSAANFTGTVAVATSISTPTITTASGDLTIDPTGNTIVKGSTSVTGTAALDIQNSTASILYARNDGNIGIGTTAPGARLQVASAGNTATSYTARFQSSGSVGGAGGILFDQGSTYSYKLSTLGTSATTGSLTWAYINQSTGADQFSNVLSLYNGSVGVGTSSPGYKLDVQGGDMNTSANLRTGGTIRIDASGNLSNIGTIGSGAITSTSTIQGTQLISTVATGTAPLTVASTTKVTNLNADLLDGLDSTAFAVASGGTGYIQNQTAGAQSTSNFWLSGTGRADTSITTPLLDTATGVALNVGTNNATIINLNQNTAIASGKSLTVTSGVTIFTGLAGGSSTGLTVNPGATTNVGLVVKGIASQSADLQQIQDSNGAVLSKVNAAGAVSSYGTTTTLTGLATPAFTTVSTGSSYYYAITATNAGGETIYGSGLGMANNTSTLDWTQVSGATGYKIYRNTSNSFSSGSRLLATITNGTTVSYTDTGSATGAGLPPASVTGTKLYVSAWGGQNSSQVLQIQNGNASDIFSITAEGATAIRLQNDNTTGLYIRGKSLSQVGDLMQFQDSGALVNGSINALGNQLTLGRIAASGTVTQGKLRLSDGTTSNFGTTLQSATLTTGNQTIIIPDTAGAGGTICLQSSASCGFAAGTAASYIQNQTAGAQSTSNFWISGTGRADTSITTPLLDTATAVALNIGTTNATVINLNENTTVAAGKTLTVGTGATSLGGTLAVTGNATFDTNTLFVDTTNNRVGIGTVTPNTELDVNGTISRSQNSVRTYKNAYTYNINVGTQTGTIVLAAPRGFTSTMLRFTIKGYDYSSTTGAWEAVVSGYNYTTTPAWLNTSAEIRGNAPFTSVRLGYDGTDVVIMLGTTSTVWQYPKVVIEEIIAGFSNADDWGSGWVGSLVVSEAAYSDIVTPAQRGAFYQNGNSFGATATLGTNDAQSLVLETNGTARLTVTSAGAATFSGTLAVASTINGATISGGTISGGTLSGTAVNSLNVSGTAIQGTGSLTIDGTGAGTVSIGATSTGDILLGGGSASTGCTVTNGTGAFACASTIQGTQFTSTIATGTAPLVVASTTKVTNLNVDLLDGLDSTAFAVASGGTGYIQNQTASPQAAGFNINGNGTIGGALAVTGNSTFSGGRVNMSNGTSNLLVFGANGLGNPTFTTRSAGTKVALWDALSGSSADYALGISSGTLWSSVGTTASQFQWYGGTTLAATLSGTGSLTTVGALVGVGVNSGSGLLQGTGGVTLTGVASINTTGTAATSIGNSTGVLTVASGGASAWTNTAGNLTLSTATSGNISFQTNNAAASIIARSGTNSTTAFQVQNASSAAVLTADTSNNRILVGNATASTATPAYTFFNDGSSNAAGNATITGQWGSDANWGIGSNSNANDSTLRMGIVNENTNTWSTASNLNLLVAGTALIQPNAGLDSATAFAVRNGAGTSTALNVDTTTSNVTIGNALVIGTTTAERTFTNTFPDGVANQKFDLYFPSAGGQMEITLSGDIQYSNALGSIQKKFYLGLVSPNLIYENTSRYSEASGSTSTDFAISDVTWDATNSRFRVQIVHRVSTGNPVGINVKIMGAVPEDAAAIANSMGMSAIYTTDTTAFVKPTVSFTDNVGIGVADAGAYRLNVAATNAVVANFDRSNDGTVLQFQSGGTTQGTISIAGATTSYNAFTGSHYAHITTGTLERGMLAALTGTSDYAPGAAEPIYGVVKSETANQANILGAYLARLSPDQVYSTTNPELIMAAGNGDIWIADNGSGNVEIGDPLISSTLPGYAMRDTKTFAVSHVFAKVAEPIDWSAVTATVDGVKVAKVTGLFSYYDSDNVSGHLQGGSLDLTGNANISGNLYTTNLNVSGNTTIHDLTVTGSVTITQNLTVTGVVSVGSILVNGHVVVDGAAPLTAVGVAAGTSTVDPDHPNYPGQVAPVATTDGNDTAGTVSVTTGATVTDSGVLAEITFAQAFSDGKFKVALTPTNDHAVDIRVYVEKTASGFRIVTKDKALTATEYKFDYIVLGAHTTSSH